VTFTIFAFIVSASFSWMMLSLQLEQKRLKFERDGLAKELEIEKEKTHSFEASFEQLKRQGVQIATASALDNEAATNAKKLATLEMKEINER